MFSTITLLPLLALAVHAPAAQAAPPGSPHAALVVGWHDEMNGVDAWKPVGNDNRPDIFSANPGALTLRLPRVPDGFPYTYQWSGVTRTVSADLGRYPVLVARLGSLTPGSYAHLDVEERDIAGHTVRTWRSQTLTEAGLASIDLGKDLGADVRRLTVRLIVGGKLDGAECEYRWVRFVNRPALRRLQKTPDLQTVSSREPTGDSTYHAAR